MLKCANPLLFNHHSKDQFTEGLSTINTVTYLSFSTLTILVVENVQMLNTPPDDSLLIYSVFEEAWDLCRLTEIKTILLKSTEIWNNAKIEVFPQLSVFCCSLGYSTRPPQLTPQVFPISKNYFCCY